MNDFTPTYLKTGQRLAGGVTAARMTHPWFQDPTSPSLSPILILHKP